MKYLIKFSSLPVIKSDPLNSTRDAILLALITIPLLPGSQVNGGLLFA